MKKILFTLAFASLFLAAQAQTSGYLGKRFMVGYNARVLSTIATTQIFGLELRRIDIKPGINLQHSINADFFITPASIFGIEYGYESSTIMFEQLDMFRNVASYYAMNYKGNTIGLNFTTYGISAKAAPAPIGNYLRIKYFRTFSQFNDPLGYSSFYEYGLPPERYVAKPITGKYYRDAIGIGYGNTRVIKDRVIFDIGLEVNYFFGDPSVNSTDLDGNPLFDPSVDFFSLYGSANHFLNLKLGLSGLLF